MAISDPDAGETINKRQGLTILRDPVEVAVETGGVWLPGSLVIPPRAAGLVVFAHASGSSRAAPRVTIAACLKRTPPRNSPMTAIGR